VTLGEVVLAGLSATSFRRPIAVDLFAGAGGLTLGFEMAGWDVVASVEYDGVHAATHAFNFPATRVLCRDISTVRSSEIREAAVAGYRAHTGSEAWDGELDAVIGGPPCQGFSLIGRRLVDDQRNRLVYEFVRLAAELEPKYIMMENVPGMLSGGHSSILDQVVDELELRGYRIRYPVTVLNAADYGVPQRRRRVFLVAARQGLPLPEYPIETTAAHRATGQIQLDARGLPRVPSVMDAIGDLPDADLFPELLTSDEVSLPEADLSRARGQASEYAQRLRGDVHDPHDFSYPRLWASGLLTSSMRTVHRPSSTKRFEATEPGSFEPTSRLYRLPPDGVANTLRAGTGSERGAFSSPRPIHPLHNRVITVREAARLHGFPDWFRFNRTKWHGFRQVGNSVPPLLARAVAGEISRVLRVAGARPTHIQRLDQPGLLSLDMTNAAEIFGTSRSDMPAPRMRSRARSAG
jgi:DNA (cytosine-5)-methyltransferase 1